MNEIPIEVLQSFLVILLGRLGNKAVIQIEDIRDAVGHHVFKVTAGGDESLTIELIQPELTVQ